MINTGWNLETIAADVADYMDNVHGGTISVVYFCEKNRLSMATEKIKIVVRHEKPEFYVSVDRPTEPVVDDIISSSPSLVTLRAIDLIVAAELG